MLSFAIVDSVTSPIVSLATLDFDEFSRRLGNCRVGPKDGSGWVAAEIDKGRRADERVRAGTATVLDIERTSEDGEVPPSFEEMTERVRQLGYRAKLHTTFSHTEELPRMRVIFELSRKLTKDEIRPMVHYCAERLGTTNYTDFKCTDSSRLFFDPRAPEERIKFFRHDDVQGPLLPVDEFMRARKMFEKAKKAPPKAHNSESFIKTFNDSHDAGVMLTQFGYKHCYGKRWLPEKSESKLAGVVLWDDGRVFSHHNKAHDPLADELPHDCYDLLTILKYDGDELRARDEAKRITNFNLNGQKQTNFADESDEIELIYGNTIKPKAIDWLWKGWMAESMFHLLGGAPGAGKTTLTLKMMATITTGGTWPDGTVAPLGKVVIWSGEDDKETVLVPRLMKMGAEMSRVIFVGTVKNLTNLANRRAFDPAIDMDTLKRRLSEIRDVKLLVVDSIVSAVAGDSHKNSETRRGLQPLIDLCSSLRITALGLTHFTKSSHGKDPLERITGSLAFGAVARVVMVAAKHVEENEHGKYKRTVVRAKSNIGPDEGGFEYEAVFGPLKLDDGEVIEEVMSMEWRSAVEGDAREILEEADSDGSEDTTSSVKRWVFNYLKDCPSGADMKDINKAGILEGYSVRTIRRAADKLRVDMKPSGFGKDRRSHWKLPDKPIIATKPYQGNYGNNGINDTNGNNEDVEL